jgi:hypothetical protein
MNKLKKILLGLLLSFIIGAVIGTVVFIIGDLASGGNIEPEYAESEDQEEPQERGFDFIRPAIIAVVFCVGIYLHIIVHEGGHLVAGKLSGYGFVSFRVGSFTLVKKDGKLVRRKYGIAGTGGQCLMSPPDVADCEYKYPFVLYNLGGALANFAVSAVFLTIGILTTAYIASVFVIVAVVGVLIGLSNIIPLKLGGISNDGMNAVLCRKDMQIRRAMWIQLKFAALITQGVRVRDIPQEWVENIGIPKDPVTGFLTGLRCSYLLEKGEFVQLQKYAHEILEAAADSKGMMELHKNELRCELLFCELIGECRTDEVEKLYTEKLREHIKGLSTHLSRRRLMYAYERLFTKNNVKAEKALTDFEKACLHTPFEGEIAGERELVELVDSVKQKGSYDEQ